MAVTLESEKTLTRRTHRDIIDNFYSVEINIDRGCMINQYVIYDISTKGLCLLIKEDSEVLENIEVGGIYKMKYYPNNLLDSVKYFNTEIRHITKSNSKKYKGYYLVGLSISGEK